MKPEMTIREFVEILETLEKLSKKLLQDNKEWEEYSQKQEDCNQALIRQMIQENAQDVANIEKLKLMINNTKLKFTTEA
jgi:hypothetical protein